MKKPIRVVNEDEWYVVIMERVKPGVRLLWRTAVRTFVPVEVIRGRADLQVRCLSTDENQGKIYGIYFEQVVECEFENEIVRLDCCLTSI